MDSTAQDILSFLDDMLTDGPDDFEVSSTHRDSTGALVVDLESEDPSVRRAYRITIEYIGD